MTLKITIVDAVIKHNTEPQGFVMVLLGVDRNHMSSYIPVTPSSRLDLQVEANLVGEIPSLSQKERNT